MSWKPFENRKYETEAVKQLLVDLPKHRRVLAVAPTGSGKTVIASMLIKKGPWDRVLFVAHTRELIYQAHRKLRDNGIDAGIIMAADEDLHGGKHIIPDARVQVASIQTVANRGVSFKPDLIVFDEAHRSMADTYQRIAKRSSQVLGLTATPVRNDGKGLGDFFQQLVICAAQSDLYREGFLAKPRVWGAPKLATEQLSTRLKQVSMVHGDFNRRELEVAVNSRTLIGNIVSETIRLAPGVPKLVFAASVKHSKSIAKRFQRRGIKAMHLDGDTPGDERQHILRDLKKGWIEIVCNVDVLSEGWDLPALGAVIIARPTKSLARYLQMCGRVQRPFGRRVPRIIDHGNNVERHQVLPFDDYEWSLDGAKPKTGAAVVKPCDECREMIAGGCKTCPHCGAEQPLSSRAIAELKEREAELEELTKLRDKIRVRAAKVAKEVGAPQEWVGKVVESVVSSAM